jgi:hypothetical protein
MRVALTVENVQFTKGGSLVGMSPIKSSVARANDYIAVVNT